MAGVRPRMIRTALGEVHLERPWWHCGSCHSGFAPVETRYGISAAGTSPGYDKILALTGAEQSFPGLGGLITELTGIRLAPATTLARSTTRRVGAAARESADAETAPIKAGTRILLVTEPALELCYILIDGTGAPMVPKETEGRQGKGPTADPDPEVKIGCLFTQAHAATGGGEPTQDRHSASYIATFEAAEGFADQLRDEHRRRGFDRIRQPIVIGDGAKWIWNIAERLFPEATHIVDYWHASEHVHDLVKIFDHILSDPAAFTQQLIGHLDHGNIDAIVTAVEALRLGGYKGNLAANGPARPSTTSLATPTACNTTTTAPRAGSSAPAPSKQPAKPSSPNAPNKPACAGPSPDSTRSSPSGRSPAPDATHSSGTTTYPRHRQPKQPEPQS